MIKEKGFSDKSDTSNFVKSSDLKTKLARKSKSKKTRKSNIYT